MFGISTDQCFITFLSFSDFVYLKWQLNCPSKIALFVILNIQCNPDLTRMLGFTSFWPRYRWTANRIRSAAIIRSQTIYPFLQHPRRLHTIVYFTDVLSNCFITCWHKYIYIIPVFVLKKKSFSKIAQKITSMFHWWYPFAKNSAYFSDVRIAKDYLWNTEKNFDN